MGGPGGAAIRRLDHEAAHPRIEGVAGAHVEGAGATSEGCGARHGAAHEIRHWSPGGGGAEEVGGLPEAAAGCEQVDGVACGVRGVGQDGAGAPTIHLVEGHSVLDEGRRGRPKAHPLGAADGGGALGAKKVRELGGVSGPLPFGLGEQALGKVGAQVATHALPEPFQAAPGLVLDLDIVPAGEALVVQLPGLVGIVLRRQGQGRQPKSKKGTCGSGTHG